jgi:two-component system nitrate/nitrite sensor histidine kinase NarX
MKFRWSVIGLTAVGLGADRYLRLVKENRVLKVRLAQSEMKRDQANQRLYTIFRINQMFAEACDEQQVVEILLSFSLELAQANGASFVPLDEHGQTLPAFNYGELPFQGASAWIEYLASPSVRKQCKNCERSGQLTNQCPLLENPALNGLGIFCLPVRRVDLEFGMLNLYLPQNSRIGDDLQAVFRTLADEAALALEGIRLRKREVATLQLLQSERERTDLKSLLSGLLKTLQEAFDADFTMAYLDSEASRVTYGELPAGERPLVDQILHKVITLKQPLSFNKGQAETGFQALIAVPIAIQNRPVLGVLLVSRRSKPFTPRQLSMLENLAVQVAIVVQNFYQIAELEYKTVIEERTRLAREIHDGLAQTLGFLKLKTAQMMNYLDRGESDLLRKTIQVSYATLSDAYQDARQAIDGLRISSYENGLSGWLKQVVSEYQEYNEGNVILCDDAGSVDLPPEIHAQLIRIVQEALSNIRKHAHAAHVWINVKQAAGFLYLDIQDDGQGFTPEDVPDPSQHGLRGMRERAELIGASFNITAEPGKGAKVSIRLPLITEHRNDGVQGVE